MDRYTILIPIVVAIYLVLWTLVLSILFAVIWGWIVDPSYWFWMMGAIPLYMTWNWTLAHPVAFILGFAIAILSLLIQYKLASKF
jgi:hypothetical protein